MAVRTIRPVAFGDDRYIEYDYDDGTGQILAVRGVNNSAGPLFISLRGTETSGQAAGVEYSYTFDAGSGLTEFSIPPGQRKRFTLEPDGRGPEAEGEPDYYPTLRGFTFWAGT